MIFRNIFSKEKTLNINFSPIQKKIETPEDLYHLYTDLIRQTNKIHEAENNLRLAWDIFENSREGIVITNLDGNIIKTNPANSLITGYGNEDLIGKNPRQFKSGRHGKEFYKKMWESIFNDGFWEGEIQDRKKDGSIFTKWLRINTVFDESGLPLFYTGIFSDLTRIKEIEDELNKIVFFDSLTGLANRASFNEYLCQEIAQSDRDKFKTVVFYIDINRFKFINESLGHNFGNRILQEVSMRLKSCLKPTDTAARFGGDEFVLLLRDIKKTESLAKIANHIYNTIKSPITIEKKDYLVEVSIGISIFPDDGNDAAAIIKNSETAMYRAKSKHGVSFYFYSNDMNDYGNLFLEMENMVCTAIQLREFSVYYQPLICIKTEKTIMFEALARWRHEPKGFIPPEKFIPIAEENGLIGIIDELVMENVCKQINVWKKKGFEIKPVAINISPIEISQIDFMERVCNILKKYSLSPENIEFELTERALMDDSGNTLRMFNSLRKAGFRFSLDDFGTGFSSLSYLCKYDVYKIKIDRSFTHLLLTDQKSKALTRSILLMAKSLGMKTVAEGVETRKQLDFYREESCDEIQGFYFSKPLSADDTIKYMEKLV
jgi:diguanylate cyclase (GGDEF)-like protein/PAS domain S-box-containing protein